MRRGRSLNLAAGEVHCWARASLAREGITDMTSAARRFLVALLISASAPALAQDDDVAPPDRAGRVSAIEGRMTFKDADDQEWSEVSPNYPVAQGMSFATAPDARAEIELGATTLRLGGRTAATIETLDDNATTISIDDGSIDIRPRILFDDEKLTVTATHGQISLLQAGAYRIDSGLGSEPTRVVVFQGRAEIETARGREEVRAGDAVEANASGQVRHVASYPTEIDQWAEMRENARERSPSRDYVGDDMPGYSDLDNAGTWQKTVDYGAVWYPSAVPYGWEPYAFGQWVWVRPWGWTWVDDQPWGFAPFHYGRWVSVSGRWGWSPGERMRRPVYAPALVAFVGNDPWRFHSRSMRPSRWVPLAPGEAYRAPYTRNVAYLRLVNRGHMHKDALDRFDWRGRNGDFANNRYFRSADQNFPRTRNGSTPRRPAVIADPGNGARNERGERTIGRGRDFNRGAIGDNTWGSGQAGNGNNTGGNRWGNRGGGNDGANGGNRGRNRGVQAVAPTPSQPNYAVPNTNGIGQFSSAPGAPPQQSTNAPGAPPLAQDNGRGWRGGRGPDQTPGTGGNGRGRRGPNAGQGDAGQPNLGQGNLGQGNLGQGSFGSGNVGQANTGANPEASRGRSRGGEGGGRRGRDTAPAP